MSTKPKRSLTRNDRGQFVPKNVRGYGELASVGGVNSDWVLSFLGEDADVWRNQTNLRARARDLFRSETYFQKYREQLFANVFGADGLHLRMKVKEEEDRVVYAADEKNFLLEYARRRSKVFQWAALRGAVSEGVAREWCEREAKFGRRAKASVLVGDPDLFANRIIEAAWHEWKRATFCDVRGQRDYVSICNLRLLSAARDGACFLRLVSDPTINRFGFALQLVNDEWCDYFANGKAPGTGNNIRMGIEANEWGRPVAYWFIKRRADAWAFGGVGAQGLFGFNGSETHDRVAAEEVIHYCRRTDADSTRPASWIASTIPKSRHLGKFEEAEVIAARVSACKMGWFYSDIVGDTFGVTSMPDPTSGVPMQEASPGAFGALPYGVKFEGYNPTHPTQNFEQFRKAMLRSWCAGLPGADYNIIGNDLEGISFSAGRLGRLDSNEMWKLLQAFDIRSAEVPVFERWLEMALTTGAIPLPRERYRKFNKPVFTGRRWVGVDPVKEANASAIAIANKLTSRTRVCAENNDDWEEIVFELAEEKMLLESLGMDDSTTQSTPNTSFASDEAVKPDDDDEAGGALPSKKHGNGPKPTASPSAQAL